MRWDQVHPTPPGRHCVRPCPPPPAPARPCPPLSAAARPCPPLLPAAPATPSPVGPDPEPWLEAVAPDGLGQPLHAVGEPLVALPVTVPALEPFVDLDDFEPVRLEMAGGEARSRESRRRSLSPAGGRLRGPHHAGAR